MSLFVGAVDKRVVGSFDAFTGWDFSMWADLRTIIVKVKKSVLLECTNSTI